MLFEVIGLYEVTREWGIDGKEKIKEWVLGNMLIKRPGRRGRTNERGSSWVGGKPKRLWPGNQVKEVSQGKGNNQVCGLLLSEIGQGLGIDNWIYC